MTCKKCRIELQPGQAIVHPMVSHTDFIGEHPSEGSTVSLSPIGVLTGCLKCPSCGFSVTKGEPL